MADNRNRNNNLNNDQQKRSDEENLKIRNHKNEQDRNYNDYEEHEEYEALEAENENKDEATWEESLEETFGMQEDPEDEDEPLFDRS